METTNNFQSNNTYDNRVSTAGITLFDQENMMLKLSYLGDSLALSICEPEVNENGKRSYPDKKRHSTLLTADRAAAMWDEIVLKKILPAVESGTDVSSGIFLNRKKDSILQIRTQAGEIYIVLCTAINEDRVSENSFVFHFQKTDIINGYTPDGQMDEQLTVNGAFFLFCKWLSCGIEAITGASGHSVRKTEQYSKNSIFNYLKGIAAKLGVTVESNNWNRGGSNSGFNLQRPNTPPPEGGFMNGPGNAEEVAFDTTPTADTMDSILS